RGDLSSASGYRCISERLGSEKARLYAPSCLARKIVDRRRSCRSRSARRGRLQASEPDICNVAPREAPLDFTLPSVDGREIALGDYAGRVILLDFWATWCAPCREEIPGLVELYERYGDAGFVVLGVAVDDEDDAVDRK